MIFAHALNNIISAHTLWNYLQGNDFSSIALTLYIPLLMISLILLFWQFPRIKEGLAESIKELRMYFTNDEKIGEANGDKYFRIFIDIAFGLLIFLIGILMV